MTDKEDKYISLKEAAKISGYSADYVGQLIRNGKLPGKQIFSHVAWVTTEEDLRGYMDNKKSVKGITPTTDYDGVFKGVLLEVSRSIKHNLVMPRLFNAVLFVALLFAFLFLMFLFYVLSVSIEHRLDQQAIEHAETQTLQP
jgi:hypothetical protein